MLALALIAAGEILAEIRTSIGKYEAARKKESLYAMGFLNAVWAMVFMALIAYFRQADFVFSLNSLPTFAARAMLEITILFVGLHAIMAADRSTHAFLRILTIPLLLAVDLALGYDIPLLRIAGICAIVIALIFLLLNHGLSRKGKFLCLLSSVLSVGTISLYKYDITHFNSVEAEQIAMYIIILFALIIAARIRVKENVFAALASPLLLLQSLASGGAAVFLSFAYLLAPASIITAVSRSMEILASMISGRSYFHEKHLIVKLIAFSLIIIGIALTTVL